MTDVENEMTEAMEQMEIEGYPQKIVTDERGVQRRVVWKSDGEDMYATLETIDPYENVTPQIIAAVLEKHPYFVWTGSSFVVAVRELHDKIHNSYELATVIVPDSQAPHTYHFETKINIHPRFMSHGLLIHYQDLFQMHESLLKALPDFFAPIPAFHTLEGRGFKEQKGTLSLPSREFAMYNSVVYRETPAWTWEDMFHFLLRQGLYWEKDHFTFLPLVVKDQICLEFTMSDVRPIACSSFVHIQRHESDPAALHQVSRAFSTMSHCLDVATKNIPLRRATTQQEIEAVVQNLQSNMEADKFRHRYAMAKDLSTLCHRRFFQLIEKVRMDPEFRFTGPSFVTWNGVHNFVPGNGYHTKWDHRHPSPMSEEQTHQVIRCLADLHTDMNRVYSWQECREICEILTIAYHSP